MAPSGDIARVALPSGGWWELRPRPLWRDVRAWNGARDDDRTETAIRALVSLTTEWSFSGDVNLESVAGRDEEDLEAVLKVVHDGLARVLPGKPLRVQAEDLFSDLVAGRVPSSFEDVHVMALTGWSWITLQDTPADVVERMVIYMSVTGARDSEGALAFLEDVHGQ